MKSGLIRLTRMPYEPASIGESSRSALSDTRDGPYGGRILIAMKTLAACLADAEMDVEDLVRASGLDRKEVKAIVNGNYTPSPPQRRLLAEVVGVSKDEIDWEHSIEVQHLWGHGPQFGRTP